MLSAPNGKEIFLNPSLAHSTVEAFEKVCRLDHRGKLERRITKAGLCAKQVSVRVSRILGPVSRFRITQILPQMNLASRASRPGLTDGFLRILCNGLCTAQRFHVEGEAQMCRVGCLDEPDSLSHYNNVLCCTTSLPLFGDRLLRFHGEAIFSTT